MLADDERLNRFERDFTDAGLEEKKVLMLDYVRRLSASPPAVESGDLDRLREVGWSDTDLLHIVEVASYYAYVNRIADGLGVEVEGEGEV